MKINTMGGARRSDESKDECMSLGSRVEEKMQEPLTWKDLDYDVLTGLEVVRTSSEEKGVG